MLKEDFKDETTKNQMTDQPHLAELEQKYQKELNEYEQKTHFMQDHQNEFEDTGGARVITSGATKKNRASQKSGYKRVEEPEIQQESTSPISASELLEKGVEIVREKAGNVWEAVKSEWKNDRKEFVRKTLVGTAVTGAAIGLILLSRRKKTEKNFMERLVNPA